MSRGGKGIIALRSTAKKGTVSTIAPMLAQGSIVTVPRHDVDCVVSEYGTARLRGRTVRARAKSLISIAHPDFRDELTFQAKKLGFI